MLTSSLGADARVRANARGGAGSMFGRIFSTIAKHVASSRLLLVLIIVLQVLYLLPALKQTTMGGW